MRSDCVNKSVENNQHHTSSDNLNCVQSSWGLLQCCQPCAAGCICLHPDAETLGLDFVGRKYGLVEIYVGLEDGLFVDYSGDKNTYVRPASGLPADLSWAPYTMQTVNSACPG